MTPFALSFKNEHIIYEKIIKCTAKNSEFNLSYNPTLLQSGSFENVQSYATSSSFSPFVTGLGLYDDFGNLLAVAKFGQPIPMSSDTDYNFLIKLDM
jgi:hypothetical protein